VTLSDQSIPLGVFLQVNANETLMCNPTWERVTNSQKRVFIRIDNNAAGGYSTYIVIRFRVRLLAVVPGVVPTVHAELEHQANLQRGDIIKDRLDQAGIPKQLTGGTYGK
jgi:hypothetical protein